MSIQIIFVVIFGLNLLLIWVSHFFKKAKWYRIIGALCFVLLPLLTVFFEQPRFELDYFWWRIAGIIFMLVGFGIIVLTIREFQKFNLKFFDLPQFLTTGPYQFVRHPFYLGLIFIFVGWWWIWAAAYSFYFGMFILALIWIQGYLEEKLILERKFNREYREYKNRTGMFWIK